MMDLRATLKRGLTRCWKAVCRGLEALSNPKVMALAVVTLSFLATLLIRLVPMRWGIYLNEFDPYYEYYLAEKIIEHSKNSILDGIVWWFSWWFDRGARDTLFWTPKGRDLRATSQPGAAMFSALTYWVLKSLGLNVDLYTVHAFVPPIGASLAVFLIYLLGREIGGESVGAISALALATSWSYAYRTNLGAKHEGLAIPFMILAFYFFITAYRRDSLLRAVLAGLSLGGVVLSWGAYLYPWNLLALTATIWLLLNPKDSRMAKVFLASNLIAQAFIAITPRFGPRVAFTSVASILPMTANALSILSLLGSLALPSPRELRKVAPGLAAGIVTALLLAWKLGVLYSLPGRILAVIVPTLREVGVTTVAEHAIPSWASLYSDYSTLLLFALVGGAMALFEYRKDPLKLLLSLFWLSSLYSAASMVRLTLLLAPATALLSAYGAQAVIGELLELLHPPKFRKGRGVSPEIVAIGIAVVVIVLSIGLVNTRGIRNSHQPPLILSSSIPVLSYKYEYTDWLSALEWIKANVPKDAVIATWWDYGYWISVNTRRKTTCDNATLDSKQIKKIARAFLSPEEEAIKIFKELGVDYVVVFEPFQSLPLQFLGTRVYYSIAHPAFGGDLGKSIQMARWIGRDPAKYIYGYGKGQLAYIESGGVRYSILVPANTPEALNATLYKMLFTKTKRRKAFIFEPILGRKLPFYEGPTYRIPPLKYFELVYASEPNEWVLIFRVKYEALAGS